MTERQRQDVAAELRASVYFACVEVFEKLEADRAILSNGHHMAQAVAALSSNLLEDRWNGPPDPEPTPSTALVLAKAL